MERQEHFLVPVFRKMNPKNRNFGEKSSDLMGKSMVFELPWFAIKVDTKSKNIFRWPFWAKTTKIAFLVGKHN